MLEIAGDAVIGKLVMGLRGEGLRRLAPATLILFVSGAVTPRIEIYFHDHTGGDHVHVHSEPSRSVHKAYRDHHSGHGHSHGDHRHEHHHGDHGDHEHHRHEHDYADTQAGAASGRSHLDEHQRIPSGHWHAVDAYGRAVLPQVAPLVGFVPAAEPSGNNDGKPATRWMLAPCVRGPPRLSASSVR